MAELRRIGILVNDQKPDAVALARQTVPWLRRREIEVRLYEGIAPQTIAAPCDDRPDPVADCDLLITFGGDGTILAAAHLAARQATPILGVHMGRFGFIAETGPDDFVTKLEQVLAGDYRIEERMRVAATVVRPDRSEEPVYCTDALNDIVVQKGARARMLRLSMAVSGQFVAVYPADGIIVASPTGSTGYSLSAGGSLVSPTVDALLVTPICPHTLNARALIVSGRDTVSVTVGADSDDVVLLADGWIGQTLQPGDRVEFRRAERPTRLVALSGSETFIDKLRDRLHWAERLNA